MLILTFDNFRLVMFLLLGIILFMDPFLGLNSLWDADIPENLSIFRTPFWLHPIPPNLER